VYEHMYVHSILQYFIDINNNASLWVPYGSRLYRRIKLKLFIYIIINFEHDCALLDSCSKPVRLWEFDFLIIISLINSMFWIASVNQCLEHTQFLLVLFCSFYCTLLYCNYISCIIIIISKKSIFNNCIIICIRVQLVSYFSNLSTYEYSIYIFIYTVHKLYAIVSLSVLHI
jgi:hypothetical protein